MDIKYNNLRIRNAKEFDSKILTKWWNDGEVMAHAGFPNGLQTTEEKVAAQIKKDSDSVGRRLIMECDDSPIGEMSYRNLGNKIAQIGIKICEVSQQEKGHGRIFLSLLIRELFSMGYKKIVLDTNLKNSRAQHVYELLGFTKLRVNLNSWKDQLGIMQSSVDYELTKDKFMDFTLF